MAIMVNQAGYEADAASKKAVIRSCTARIDIE